MYSELNAVSEKVCNAVTHCRFMAVTHVRDLHCTYGMEEFVIVHIALKEQIGLVWYGMVMFIQVAAVPRWRTQTGRNRL